MTDVESDSSGTTSPCAQASRCAELGRQLRVLRRYGVSVVIVDVVAVLVAVVVVWGLSMRLVGQVAEEFGEDPAQWRLFMLPFGIFGRVVAGVLLSRNGGGRGGFS